MQAKIYLALAGRLVTLLTPRGRSKGQGEGEKTFSFSFIVYRETFVWGLKIGFRGVIFSGSGCIYWETVQYSCFCLKIPEIVADIYIGTVQTSARENI